MPKAGFNSIDKSTQKTKEWLHEIQSDLGWEDENMVYIATRSVLQTLRDRLPVEEAVELADELPMIMKGMYYEGYKASGKPEKIKNREEFFNKVQEKSSNVQIQSEQATKAVFHTLERKLGGGGEINQVKGNLPKDIQRLWEQ
ncbi:DUF2267 domain-containing protein [Methanobacterium sp. ACI-7]|uniref:DUF2267 domain-containing protein n=1 Tax=unclassified Methanobacterium TaxID=2627676 RepID=UPI0039C347A3